MIKNRVWENIIRKNVISVGLKLRTFSVRCNILPKELKNLLEPSKQCSLLKKMFVASICVGTWGIPVKVSKFPFFSEYDPFKIFYSDVLVFL